MRANLLLTIGITAVISIALTIFVVRQIEPSNQGTDTICMNYSGRPSELKVGLIKAMVAKYESAQYKSINGFTPFNDENADDAKTIWFDLETLKKFVYHIESNVNKRCPKDPKQLGIRVYYTAYPEKDGEFERLSEMNEGAEVLDPKYLSKHTLIMIPTIRLENGVNADFNPVDGNSYIGFANMTTPPKNSEPILGLSVLPNNSSNIVAQNHGTLYPPGTPAGIAFGRHNQQ